MRIGSLTLSPTFDPNVTTYTATTTNASNGVTATAADNNATVSITLNGTALSGGSASWETGDNTLAITVTNGSASKTYTVTVTKS